MYVLGPVRKVALGSCKQPFPVRPLDLSESTQRGGEPPSSSFFHLHPPPPPPPPKFLHRLDFFSFTAFRYSWPPALPFVFIYEFLSLALYSNSYRPAMIPASPVPPTPFVETMNPERARMLANAAREASARPSAVAKEEEEDMPLPLVTGANCAPVGDAWLRAGRRLSGPNQTPSRGRNSDRVISF